jgi:hypothetical protein
MGGLPRRLLECLAVIRGFPVFVVALNRVIDIIAGSRTLVRERIYTIFSPTHSSEQVALGLPQKELARVSIQIKIPLFPNTRQKQSTLKNEKLTEYAFPLLIQHFIFVSIAAMNTSFLRVAHSSTAQSPTPIRR